MNAGTMSDPFVVPATVAKAGAGEMRWDDILSYMPGIDPDCLMGNRYLGRGCAAVITGASGVGKSVLVTKLAADAALQRFFFGLKMHTPMRVLYLQAEDDLGDVAESIQGYIGHHRLSEAHVTQLRTNLRILRWNDCSGGAFLQRLRVEHKAWPFDLVIINPLFSFCGCAVSDQKEMSGFLRNGLNPILNTTRAAAIIVHHINKPITDPKGRPGDSNTDLQYAGSGSAELTNWARACIALQAIPAADGVFKLRFTKRGTRAGIVDANGHPTASVVIEHAKDGLCWLPSDYAVEKGEGGKYAQKFDLSRAVQVYDTKLDWQANQQAIAMDQDVAIRTVRRYRKEIADMAA